jgi:hypothetical protein
MLEITIGWERLFLQMLHIGTLWSINTYKVVDFWCIPGQEGLVESRCFLEHLTLTREKNEKQNWLIRDTEVWMRFCYPAWKFKSLVITYKLGTTRDIPVTEVLVKCQGWSEHRILTWENNGKQDWMRVRLPSMQHRSNGLVSESSLEAKAKKRMSRNRASLLTKLVTRETSQLLRGWSKAEARLNIYF